LSVTGTVGFDGLTSATIGNYLCVNTTTKEITQGTSCTVSSERFKTDIVSLLPPSTLTNTGISASTYPTSALSEVLALRPVTFKFKPGFGDNGAATQIGFIAEEAINVDPRLVPVDKDGLPSGFYYENYTAVLTKAIQELDLNLEGIAGATATSTPQSQTFVAQFFKNIFARIGAWLADAGNGLTDVFAGAFHAKQEICVDNQCLNADDVKNLLALVNGMATTTSAGTSSDSATSALGITVLGNNPAHIFVGDSYSDMGVVISAGSPPADLNLGITANVDGGATTTPAEVAIDTTAPGTHSIVYSVTDSARVTASATRTVVVAPVAGSAGSQTTIATTTPTTTETATTTADTTATSTPSSI
jgi:hypothetical protein